MKEKNTSINTRIVEIGGVKDWWILKIIELGIWSMIGQCLERLIGIYTGETDYKNEILGTRKFVGYIRYFVISIVNKQSKTKQVISLGPVKTVCYIRHFVI